MAHRSYQLNAYIRIWNNITFNRPDYKQYTDNEETNSVLYQNF